MMMKRIKWQRLIFAWAIITSGCNQFAGVNYHSQATPPSPTSNTHAPKTHTNPQLQNYFHSGAVVENWSRLLDISWIGKEIIGLIQDYNSYVPHYLVKYCRSTKNKSAIKRGTAQHSQKSNSSILHAFGQCNSCRVPFLDYEEGTSLHPDLPLIMRGLSEFTYNKNTTLKRKGKTGQQYHMTFTHIDGIWHNVKTLKLTKMCRDIDLKRQKYSWRCLGPTHVFKLPVELENWVEKSYLTQKRSLEFNACHKIYFGSSLAIVVNLRTGESVALLL